MTDPVRTNELLRSLIDQDVHHAIILLDLEGTILAWRGAARRIFGYIESEVVGKRFTILFTPEDLAQGMARQELEVAAADGSVEDDRWMMRKDGSRFWATGVVSPLRDADERIVAFGKLLRNRTDLKGQIEGLEKTIEVLKRSDDRKNAFISTLAHELRNPLSSINIALDLLQRRGSTDEDHSFARATISRQVEYMQRMVSDLLDVSRIGAGQFQLTLEAVDLVEVVQAAADSCRPLIHQRTHEFQLSLPCKPLWVHADRVRLHQVFVNLIENAAKYTQYGGSIWVKVSIEGEEGVVRVEDSGIGISSEMLPRIFDMFIQADFAPEPNDGLGIGLSVVKNLVTAHHGSVQVRSDGIGTGSEFTVRLPLITRETVCSNDAP